MPQGGMNFNKDFPKEMPPMNQNDEMREPEGNFDQNRPQNNPMDFDEEIEDDTTPKFKGIKCDGDILFKDSDITVNGEDDAIHSNG